MIHGKQPQIVTLLTLRFGCSALVMIIVKELKNYELLNSKLTNNSTLGETLENIIENILQGTPNGVYADPETKLVFSPPHYTWMDTNYPAGTPREGYPVEIQALWYAALQFTGRFSEKSKYLKLANKVKINFNKLLSQKIINGWQTVCTAGRIHRQIKPSLMTIYALTSCLR